MRAKQILNEYTINGELQVEKFVEALIDESIFAFLMAYDGKLNPLVVKESLMEYYGLTGDDFYYDPNEEIPE